MEKLCSDYINNQTRLDRTGMDRAGHPPDSFSNIVQQCSGSCMEMYKLEISSTQVLALDNIHCLVHVHVCFVSSSCCALADNTEQNIQKCLIICWFEGQLCYKLITLGDKMIISSCSHIKCGSF